MRQLPHDRAGAGRALRSTALAAVALLATAACATATTTSGPVAQATSPTTRVSSSSSPDATGSTGSGSTAPTSGASGATQDLEAYRFEIVSARVADDGAALLPPSAGSVIVAVDLAVTNTSTTPQAVSTFAQLSLKLPSGAVAPEVPPDAGIRAFKDQTLAPGQRIQGIVLYEVPADTASSLRLQLTGDLGSDATVDLHPGAG